jgi:hypothetical protein
MEGINGIDLNDELLREALVQNGRSLNGKNTYIMSLMVAMEIVTHACTCCSRFYFVAILDVARNALDDTVAPEDNIFKFINKEEE